MEPLPPPTPEADLSAEPLSLRTLVLPQIFRLDRPDSSCIGQLAAMGVEAFAQLEPHASSILHVDELHYFRPLPAERRRISYLLGRYAAKVALGSAVGNPTLPSIRIAPGVFNNPVVHYPMEQPWQVSISHSDAIVCAIAFPMVHPMAVDVESIDPDRVQVMLAQCQEPEISEANGLGLDLPTTAALLWTAKEALSKVLCTGLMCPFDVFAVHALVRMGPTEFEGIYRNLAQYKFRSWIIGESILTMTLPKRTSITFDTGSPSLGRSVNNVNGGGQ